MFVGYGVVAPEKGWDDYKGVDVRGKTLVMLVNDPPVPTRRRRARPKMFGGRAMTYYGRWTYKYEIAAKRGRRRADRPRDLPCRLSVRGRAGEDGRAVHLCLARQQHARAHMAACNRAARQLYRNFMALLPAASRARA